MYDIIRCEAKERYGFTELILFSKIKNRIAIIDEDKDILKNINFQGIFLIKNFRLSPEMVKVVGEKKKGIFLVDLSQLYTSKGVKKGILLSQIRSFLKFCIKYGTRYSFASLAVKEEEIRSPKEIAGICSLFGLNEGQTQFALKQLEVVLD